MKTPNPCPFCKNQKPWVRVEPYSIGPCLAYVRCACGLSGPVGHTEDNAIISWNRIFVAPDERIIEELNNRQQDYRTDKGA